jgi:hypothetical protein
MSIEWWSGAVGVGVWKHTRPAMRELVLPSSRPRGTGRVLLLALPVMVAALLLYRDLYTGSKPPAVTNREVLSINLALNARFCGTSRALSSRYSPYVFLAARRDLMQQPFADLIAAHAGSIPEYCRTVTAPYSLAENSVMWLARLMLWLRPNLTPDGLSQSFGALRVSMILIFGFALIRAGAPLVVAAACVLVGCEVLRGVGIRDTPYPFLLALSLLHAACYGLASASGLTTKGPRRLSMFALGMGLLTAFSASVRTILLPTAAAMFGVFLFAELRNRRAANTGRPLALAAVATIAFGSGYAIYTRALIDPLRFRDDETISAYTYHTLAHPLVLGLAVPESAFTRREGIQWNDMVGLALARRIAPDVELLGPGYERTLFRYYGRLWRDHPRDMLMVYLGKLRATGRGVFQSVAAVLAQFGVPSAPAEWLDRVTNGMMLVAFALVTFAFALKRHLAGGDGGMLMMALVSLAAMAALGEAFIMHSLYISAYYNELLFFVIVGPLCWLQTAADLVARAWQPARNRPEYAGPALPPPSC